MTLLIQPDPIRLKNFTISIYDMLGQKYYDEIALTQEHSQINVNNLHSGIYIIVVKNNNRKINTIRFVKE